jgi:predicted nicotinamide N-methyase
MEERIARIQPKRNLRCKLTQGKKYSLSFSLCSEFMDEIVGVCIESIPFQLEIMHSKLNYIRSIHITKEPSSKDNICTISFSVPESGSCQFLLRAEQPNVDGLFIVPFMSETVEITTENTPANNFLTNYRVFNSDPLNFPGFIGESIVIKEEYGLTIGSHVYDSAIVLCQYLKYHIPPNQLRSCHILELGSGLGLVSIYLMRQFQCSPIITDRKEQLPLLQENCRINHIRPTIQKFDWTDSQDLQNLQDLIVNSSSSIDYLLAADVLYDATIISLFFQVLLKLSETINMKRQKKGGSIIDPVKVLVAQKNRNKLSVDGMKSYLENHFQQSQKDGSSVLQLCLDCKYEFCDVMIWECSFVSQGSR